ncbi:MAG: ComF family protein [Verrucomicrobiae bacterium]|nr:ComF family protein [Verrucomicrobiae bacterium]MCP5540005.1 ComF family protein [Akkermansiaceae bacterium]MCP5549940.1 ComF family protein [Akkermansiaceae bacterium]
MRKPLPWLGTLRSLADGALGAIYPRICAGCEKPLDASGERWLCPECRAGLHRIERPYCDVCGQPYSGEISLSSFQCSNCSDLDLAFDFAVAPWRAEGLARELIHGFKYEGRHHLRALLGGWLPLAFDDPRLAKFADADWLLTPVPLHPRRLREREYNQAAELCRVFHRERPRFRVADVLERVRYTSRQASLDREGRLKNLKDAFRLSQSPRKRDRVRDREVLLIDDVLTTGTTASECARVLREEGGASKVVVITVVRG